MTTFVVAIPLSKNDVIAGQNGGDGKNIFWKVFSNKTHGI